MKKYFNILEKVKLFEKISETGLYEMLLCLGAKVTEAKKGQFLLLAGCEVHNIGVIIEGEAHIIKEGLDGERIIISALSPGDFFGEALCCAGIDESPVSVIAVSNTKVIFLEFRRILQSCPNSCLFHAQIIENMLYIIANKNILLQTRIDIISKKTLRVKVIAYLEHLQKEHEKNIDIPFSREELANFLCVDRSALSHELSRMKKDGLIDYHKNHFRLL